MAKLQDFHYAFKLLELVQHLKSHQFRLYHRRDYC